MDHWIDLSDFFNLILSLIKKEGLASFFFSDWLYYFYQIETLQMESALETRSGGQSISTGLEVDERGEFIEFDFL